MSGRKIVCVGRGMPSRKHGRPGIGPARRYAPRVVAWFARRAPGQNNNSGLCNVSLVWEAVGFYGGYFGGFAPMLAIGPGGFMPPFGWTWVHPFMPGSRTAAAATAAAV